MDRDTSLHGALETGWLYNQTDLNSILVPLPLISCLAPGKLVHFSKPQIVSSSVNWGESHVSGRIANRFK